MKTKDAILNRIIQSRREQVSKQYADESEKAILDLLEIAKSNDYEILDFGKGFLTIQTDHKHWYVQHTLSVTKQGKAELTSSSFMKEKGK